MSSKPLMDSSFERLINGEMETPDSAGNRPAAAEVGKAFVKAYYPLLSESPERLRRFYSNESIFVYGSEEHIGQNDIGSKIEALGFKDSSIRIMASHSHNTICNGVVVQVMGEIGVTGSEKMRRFVQTFILAPQTNTQYYVHNDIFCYDDVDTPIIVETGEEKKRSEIDVMETHLVVQSDQGSKNGPSALENDLPKTRLTSDQQAQSPVKPMHGAMEATALQESSTMQPKMEMVAPQPVPLEAATPDENRMIDENHQRSYHQHNELYSVAVTSPGPQSEAQQMQHYAYSQPPHGQQQQYHQQEETRVVELSPTPPSSFSTVSPIGPQELLNPAQPPPPGGHLMMKESQSQPLAVQVHPFSYAKVTQARPIQFMQQQPSYVLYQQPSPMMFGGPPQALQMRYPMDYQQYVRAQMQQYPPQQQFVQPQYRPYPNPIPQGTSAPSDPPTAPPGAGVAISYSGSGSTTTTAPPPPPSIHHPNAHVPPEQRVYVQAIPDTISDEVLRSMLMSHGGMVLEMRVSRRGAPYPSYAYVTMDSVESARKLLSVQRFLCRDGSYFLLKPYQPIPRSNSGHYTAPDGSGNQGGGSRGGGGGQQNQRGGTYNYGDGHARAGGRAGNAYGSGGGGGGANRGDGRPKGGHPQNK